MQQVAKKTFFNVTLKFQKKNSNFCIRCDTIGLLCI